MPTMSLSNKVVLITGGASGIAKSCVEKLLKNDVKGIVIADINMDVGEQVAKDFNAKYGQEKVIFVKTDVSNKDSFENAFQKTVEKYNAIDILINAAAIFDEINWERLLKINVFGTTYGCLLAINKYFPKYKSGSEAIIINLASDVAFQPLSYAPHYTSSKMAIIGLTRSFGMNKTVAKQGVCIMAICPGPTDTPMFDMFQESRPVIYSELLAEDLANFVTQKAEVVSRSVIEVLSKPESGSSWIVKQGVLSKVNYPSLKQMTTASS